MESKSKMMQQQADIVTCGLEVYKEAMERPFTTHGLSVFGNAWDETAKE
ncbi:hypothetical protein [Halalkalibacter alkaliphilus]|uniref:Uncharacterized protein n=1 Tax=Halalkalibacter alkaliphilus TaxID=2917993 RepID=A0A9X2I8G3_9BACI|nr:hypothetical protein [Halalkalibacter alkaliphilus]MCL7748854.1 hypothetical protein [Halalkalibacter alkaliphilus]